MMNFKHGMELDLVGLDVLSAKKRFILKRNDL